MDWQAGAIIIQNPIDIRQWRKPCREDAQRAGDRNPPPGMVSADAAKQVAPHNGTNDYYVDTVKTVRLQNINKRFNHSGMVNPLKKNQPEQQPSWQSQAKSRRERALPGDTKIIQGFLRRISCHKTIHTILS